MQQHIYSHKHAPHTQTEIYTLDGRTSVIVPPVRPVLQPPPRRPHFHRVDAYMLAENHPAEKTPCSSTPIQSARLLQGARQQRVFQVLFYCLMADSAIQWSPVPLAWRHWRRVASIPSCVCSSLQRPHAHLGQAAGTRTVISLFPAILLLP